MTTIKRVVVAKGVGMDENVVDAFFREYVYGFMFTDIQREIALARLKLGGGNFLAALALLCYTEVLGGVMRDKLERGESRKNFMEFFARLGSCYDALCKDKGIHVYNVFRCGMAHEYFVKGNCAIAMLKGQEECGIERDPSGRLYFVVERYFDDFAAACHTLHEEMSRRPVPSVLAEGHRGSYYLDESGSRGATGPSGPAG